MAVDVVVINYHTYDLLYDFCASFEKHAFEGCTLTVVDVEPNVVSPDIFQNEHVWLSIPENCGYGKACNTGAFLGKNDVILLANADTLLTDGFEECYEALINHDDWGVLGPRQVNEVNQITSAGIFGTEQSIGPRGWNERDCGQYNDVRTDAKSVSGSLYFIKRRIWDELTACEFYQEYSPGALGAFLETPHYFEETACSYHVRNHGYKCVYYGPVQMIHLWHRASEHGGWADRQFNTSLAMMRQFAATHNFICE